MNKIKWRFMPFKAKIEYAMKVCFENKQALHFAGFIFDFETMTIEKE